MTRSLILTANGRSWHANVALALQWPWQLGGLTEPASCGSIHVPGAVALGSGPGLLPRTEERPGLARQALSSSMMIGRIFASQMPPAP